MNLDDTSSFQLRNIRLKLEEKRRVIENEKRKMELLMNKQRQKVGKAAFLQAISKVGLKCINECMHFMYISIV